MDDFPADHFFKLPLGLGIDRSSQTSLGRQVADGLRAAIRAGQVPVGSRLPSSRDLARELGVSRSVTVAAYEQLEAEGYLEGRIGSGSYVAAGAEANTAGDGSSGQGSGLPPRVSRSLGKARVPGGAAGLIDFDAASGCPDLDSFPRAAWAGCLSAAARDRGVDYGFGEIAGSPSLRQAIAHYLFRMKGLSCSADEIIVTAGASQAMLLLGLYLASRWERIQIEDPTYSPLRALLKRLGLRLEPIAVDAGGLPAREVSASLPLLVTPAHHFPTGAVLQAERREAIAAGARAGGGMIIEDDYDGELRLRGFPIQPLRGLAPERVVFMGSFSKVMFPGIRLGYLVAPTAMLDRLLGIKYRAALWADALTQAALARFIDDGRLDRRVRGLKRDCAAKRALIEELAAGLPGSPLVEGEPCGMHLRLAFPGGLPSGFAQRAMRAAGFAATPVSNLSLLPGRSLGDSLLLGYGNLGEAEIREGLRRMGDYLKRVG